MVKNSVALIFLANANGSYPFSSRNLEGAREDDDHRLFIGKYVRHTDPSFSQSNKLYE